ncbi:MAG: leucyl/phenylalanyl-tRNA--protein transferase, partial [Alphaproteobacteria bacterium]
MSHLTPALMVRAYAAGFFPMASSREDTELHWLSPEERGVLPLEMFHLSRRLRRTFCGGAFLLSVNTAFRDVVGSCATAHGTSWINHEIELLYGEMFDSGLAHSVEVWRLEGSGRILVGGLYGLSLGGVFFGESMFSRMRDASKVALVELVLRLRCGGYSLL